MARKIKIDNAILKRRERKERKRKTQFKSKRKFYLIVCEGEKTEPNYFNSLKYSLPKGVLELVNIDVNGTGKNTLSIIEETKKLRKTYETKYLRKIKFGQYLTETVTLLKILIMLFTKEKTQNLRSIVHGQMKHLSYGIYFISIITTQEFQETVIRNYSNKKLSYYLETSTLNTKRIQKICMICLRILVIKISQLRILKS